MIAADTLEIDGDRLARELAELARITDAQPTSEGTSVTRVVFTGRDLEARGYVRELAEAAGLSMREDAVGNTFFRLEGADPALPPVATGSHIDAIPHAGMYDGTVGVLGGIEALRAIQRAGLRLRRPVELVLFTAEEPTRFGVGCLGSRLLSGALAPEAADALLDDAGETLAQVRHAAGFRGSLGPVRLSTGHYSAWIELHIEQGPLLERSGIPLGVVTGIAAPSSCRFTLDGVGGHAGALLMPDRRDALCAAAELILGVERMARGSGALDTVATVGTCEIHPGAINSVPSRVTLSLDLRDTDAARRDAVLDAITMEAQAIARRRSVRIEQQMLNADPPAACSPHLIATLTETAASLGVPTMPMVSRAYHDSLFMARVAPIAMLFLPCRGGVSHRPDEFASAEHIVLGTRVLGASLAKLAAV